MVLLHLPRVCWSIARGMAQQRGTVASANYGYSHDAPHVYRARVNALLDADQFLHMNNASYFVHAELARWEMGVAMGHAAHTARIGAAFIVASTTMRFRRELRPLQAFEVHSSMAAADDRSMWFLQTFHSRGGDKVAGGMCRAVLRKGRSVVEPPALLASLGVDAVVLESLRAAVPKAEHEALSVLEKALA